MPCVDLWGLDLSKFDTPKTPRVLHDFPGQLLLVGEKMPPQDAYGTHRLCHVAQGPQPKE